MIIIIIIQSIKIIVKCNYCPNKYYYCCANIVHNWILLLSLKVIMELIIKPLMAKIEKNNNMSHNYNYIIFENVYIIILIIINH